ncbi:MAG: hypothetical protein ABIX28_23070 [Vicinamibacterales bacterium]
MGDITPTGHDDSARPAPEDSLPAQAWPEEPGPTDGQPVDVGGTTGTSKGEAIPKPSDPH